MVYTLFNRQPHKYRNRKTRKKRERLEHEEIGKRVVDLLGKYKTCGFSFSFRAYVLSLPRCRLLQVLKKVEEWQMEGQIPRRVLLLANDLVSYRKRCMGLWLMMHVIREYCPTIT